jgi:hypothetical protein
VINHKYFKLKLADAVTGSADEGVIEGHLSVKDNVDLAGEVVRPGAFKRTLAATGGKLPMLFSHDPREPIGMWEEMREDAKGLYVKGRINLEVARGREVYALLKQGAIKGLSIGYDVLVDEIVKGIRFLKEIKLWEGSVVTFPCNPLASVESVKSHGESKYMATFSEMNDRNQVNAGMRIAMQTLDDALYMAAWSQEVDDAEAAAYIDDALTQFKAAMTEMFARKRGFAQADMGASEKSLAMGSERLVAFQSKLQALLEEGRKLDPGAAAHSNDPNKAGPADEPKDPRSDAHSDGSETLAGLLDAIRTATPSLS